MLKEIEKILNQQMTRGQFLKSIGLGILTIVGIPAVIHLLTPRVNHQVSEHTVGGGYGNGSYGA